MHFNCILDDTPLRRQASSPQSPSHLRVEKLIFGLSCHLRGRVPCPKNTDSPSAAIENFIATWQASGGAAFARQSAPVTARELKEQFKNAREPKVREILQALASIGQARETEDGRYVS